MKQILVVDNHPMMLKFMSTQLGKKGHRITTATDGLSALDVLKSFHPDIAFIDLVMPNISGDKLCHIIRSRPEFKDCFIAVLSAIVAEDGASFENCDADIFIAKSPFNKLARHVDYVMEHLAEGRAHQLKGKVLGCEDLFEREITKELLASKKHYEATLDHMSDGFLELTDNETVVFVNPAALSLIGVAEEKLLSARFSDLFDKADKGRIKALISEAVSTGRGVALDKLLEINHKLVSLKMIPVKNQLDENGMLVMLTDVTQQQQLELQLQRARKMEAMGTLAGGVAHDLNNILSGVVTYPDLLLPQLPEDSPLRKPLMTMQDSGNKAVAIVQDLLTLARRGVGNKAVVNLNHIIADFLDSPEYEKLQSYHPGIQVSLNLDEHLLNMEGSPVHLSKTIMNLVSNATEAIADAGRVTISTQNCYVTTPIRGYETIAEGEYICLTVSDTGIGISADDIERVFEPFYTKKKMGRSGTGLGMSVVWGTVKDHHGYIDIQSNPETGSTITVYFPATRKELPEQELPQPISDYRGNDESILVIDDVIEQREIAFTLLTMLGYTVDVVSSGEEALAYLQHRKVDLVLLDMIMDPGMDGLDTYKKILELHPSQKAILVSGFSETERIQEAQKLGAGEFLKKPYSLEALGIAVKQQLKR